jgi:hypothetical protein
MGQRNMTKHVMTSADRTKIIEALKNNPNAAAVARQFGFGETTIHTLCKKEKIGLQHLLTKAERIEVVEMLKTNLNALATAKQLGVNHKTVLAIAKKERIDIKAMRQAAKGRKTLPFTQWARGRGGKLVLQCAVYLSDGSTARHKGSRNYSRLSVSLNTSHLDVAAQRMRLILWQAIADKRLLRGVKHPAWRLYGGPIPRSTKRLLTQLAGLPWAEYELQRKKAAESLGLHVRAVDWLAKQDKARPESTTAINSRRARLRKAGHRFPNRDSWHFGAVGSVLAIHPGRQIYAQLTIANSIFRWRLSARDRDEAAAIIEPVRSARAQVRKAAQEWGACELGTPASVAAKARVVAACGRYATALSAVGAPAESIRLAMKPPTEVGTSSLLPLAASRRPIKQRDEKNCVDELTNLIKAKARMTVPEVARWAKENFGVPRRRAVEDKNCCLNQARKQANNFEWPPRGRPRDNSHQ